MKTTIILLLICGTLSAQYKPAPSLAEMCKKPRVEAWSYTPPENYIAGAMLLGSYFKIDAYDKQLFNQYGRGLERTQQRNIMYAKCMGATVVTFVVVKETRKFIEKKTSRIYKHNYRLKNR